MMKKTIRVKTEQRTQLVEFLVAKRVKYLAYLKDLHSNDGGLWMNTLFFNRAYLGRYFGVASDCLACGSGSAEEAETAGIVRIPLDSTYELDDPAAAATTPATAAAAYQRDARAPAAGGEYAYVSLDRLPNPASSGRDSSIAEWQHRHLPCYVALSLSLSDLLQVPVSGEEFIEALHHLVLEVEAAFASGLAARALAQRNLKSFRQHMSPALTEALRGGAGDSDADAAMAAVARGGSANGGCDANPNASLSLGFSATAAAATGSEQQQQQAKFFFLQDRHLAFTAGSPGYDVVMPALFSLLIFAYRRLCDYDLTGRADCVKRILSIDKRVEKLVLGRLGKELERAATLRLVREAYILSTRGLFADLVGDEGGADFVNDIVAASLAVPSGRSAGSTAGGVGRGAGAAGDEDEDSSSDSDGAAEEA